MGPPRLGGGGQAFGEIGIFWLGHLTPADRSLLRGALGYTQIRPQANGKIMARDPASFASARMIQTCARRAGSPWVTGPWHQTQARGLPAGRASGGQAQGDETHGGEAGKNGVARPAVHSEVIQ